MANKHEHHAEYKHFPATGLRARELGEIYYFTGKRCTKGHLALRYASSGNCVQCIADVRGKSEINYRGKSSIRSKANQITAMQAVADGFTEYQATDSCPKGHYRRYVTNNNCIDCNDIKRQQRSEKAKWARIKKEYGLFKLDVEQILNAQNYQCAICSTGIETSYHIDHCHSTEKVRGLLCQKCNQGIGLLQEDESLFLKAVQYIRRHNETA